MKKLIQDEQQQYQKMKEELLFLQSSSMDETRIREMWNQIEQEKFQKEREQVRYDQWLKEREEKKLEMERQWRPNYGLNKSQIIKATKTNLEVLDMDIEEPALTSPLKQQNSNLPGTSPSPLLTSLLKSPSQASTQSSIHVSGSTNSARSAPTITNLLTGGSCIISSASNSPNIINLQNPLPTQINSSAIPHNNIIINASGQLLSSAIDHNNVVQIPVSQSAPTLITLLDKKPAPIATTSINFNVSAMGAVPQAQLLQQQSIIELPTASGSNTMDTQPEMNADDSQLYAEFRDMMDPKFEIDEDCLEDINSIISAPEMDKIGSGAPIQMEVNVSQLSNADDYDQLRIKQLVESFDNPVVGQIPGPVTIASVKIVDAPQETSIFQTSNKPTIFQQFQQQFDAGKIAGDNMELNMQVTDTPDLPQEFNKDQENSQDVDTGKIDANTIETIEVTSDENSNTNEMTDQPEGNVVLKEDEKAINKQPEEIKNEDKNMVDDECESGSKDPRIKSEVQIVIQKCDKENKAEDANESIDELMPETSSVINVNDSDEDADIFEDAKEQQENEVKKEAKLVKELLEQSVGGSQTVELGASKVTTEEEANSTCISLDSDDDIIEVSRSDKIGRVTRDYSRKKISDTPSKSDKEDHAGKSREVSENSNDDNNSDTPITRTRSRNSSTVPDTSKTPSTSTGCTVEQDHTMWKSKFCSAMQQISELKDYEAIIDGKVIPNESQKNVIYHPMNLRQLQRNVENDILTMPSDVKRDFGLMCTNIIMLNKKGSKFNDNVYKFMQDSWEIFEESLEVEDTFKSYRKTIKKKAKE